jgi:hypothetical protein
MADANREIGVPGFLHGASHWASLINALLKIASRYS